MFSSKYGKCQSGSISATPSAEMNSVEMTFAIAVIPSSRVVSVGGPAQHPNLIARLRTPDPTLPVWCASDPARRRSRRARRQMGVADVAAASLLITGWAEGRRGGSRQFGIWVNGEETAGSVVVDERVLG